MWILPEACWEYPEKGGQEMKKIAVIICLVFCAGCTQQNLPLRAQVQLGMSIGEVWQLYGYDKIEPLETYKKVKYTLVEERDTEKCTFTTHRYWFKDTRPSAGNQPYLLTFISCRLPNYDEVQVERNRRRELFENDPVLKRKLDAFCEKYPVDSKDRDKLVELIHIYINDPLPQCMSEKMLIEISDDKSPPSLPL
jgi:hypothetical protein